jgi:dehydrogenase/reductase SDR family member 7B
MEQLKNKIAIVTGASSGIGKALSIALAEQGCNLAIAARNSESLNATAELVRGKGVCCIAIVTDVTKEKDCKNLIDATIREFGTIHILVNNAGITMRALFNDADISVIRQLMDTNFWSMVYCTKYALPEILKNKGSVVGISSIAGYKGLPGRTGYSASKFAMQGFLESLRIENLKTGLHVLIACPGYTASNIRNAALNKDGKSQSESPLDESKLMTAEKVAQHIVNAIINRKRTIVLTTQGKLVVWLNKFFPGFMDKQVYNTVAKEKDSPFK